MAKQPMTSVEYLRHYYNENYHAAVKPFGDAWVIEVITKWPKQKPYYEPIKTASGFFHFFSTYQAACDFMADALEDL